MRNPKYLLDGIDDGWNIGGIESSHQLARPDSVEPLFPSTS